MSLTLSLNGLSLKLNKFTDNKLPRAVIDPYGGVEYSIYGTPIGDGPAFEPKFVWAVTAFVDKDQERLIGAIYAEFDRLRRTQPYQSANILLIDINQEYQEKLPRTRALAPDTTQQFVGAAHVSYFAQFYVWMVKPPELVENGIWRTVTLTLQETDRVAS